MTRVVKEPQAPLYTALRLLFVEDSEDDALLLLKEIRRGDYDVFSKRVETPEAFVRALDEGGWDAIICDYVLPGFGALEALELTKEKGLDIPFIMVSGLVSEEKAVEAMRLGAHDYVDKGNLIRLRPAMERELRE